MSNIVFFKKNKKKYFPIDFFCCTLLAPMPTYIVPISVKLFLPLYSGMWGRREAGREIQPKHVHQHFTAVQLAFRRTSF